MEVGCSLSRSSFETVKLLVCDLPGSENSARSGSPHPAFLEFSGHPSFRKNTRPVVDFSIQTSHVTTIYEAGIPSTLYALRTAPTYVRSARE